MITKMDKYSLVLLNQEVPEFLNKLQDLGMVDINRENRAIDSHSSQVFDYLSRYKRAFQKISQLSAQSKDKQDSETSLNLDIDSMSFDELLLFCEKVITEREQLTQESDSLSREHRDSVVWGELNKDDIDKIESLGYTFGLFSIAEKKFNSSWENEYILKILNNINGRIYFIILYPKDQELIFSIPESKKPTKSHSIIESEIKQNRERLQENQLVINFLFSKADAISQKQNQISQELDLYLASKSSSSQAEGHIAILTGFAPTENRENVTNFIDSTGAYYIIDQAKEEDNPPVKLKNGFFARLYEPIGELYMLPKYGERDLTPYFAPFYMLFFGLCLGDMGYGLVLLIGATLAKFKFKEYRNYLTLIQFLGLGAVLMAALPGVIFGTKINEILPLSDNIKNIFFSDLKMFWFAIIFGLFQIVVAKLINAIDLIKNKGITYGFNSIGWIILIIWGGFKYASTMVDSLNVPQFYNYVALIALLMIVLFSSDSKNPFARLGMGAIALYHVTSIFGDMLSYIRLFGLGTAGAILGMVVNSVALSMTGIPYVGWIFTIIMLLFGHVAVLLLSSLGAFVHPMRLTFVEFYKNAEFSGGGRAYNPLSKKNTINN